MSVGAADLAALGPMLDPISSLQPPISLDEELQIGVLSAGATDLAALGQRRRRSSFDSVILYKSSISASTTSCSNSLGICHSFTQVRRSGNVSLLS